MLSVISDPNLYLLLFTAYVVGFVDTEDPAGRRVGWDRVSDLAFWCGLGLAVTLFVMHGATGGVVSLLGAWATSIVGLRRGVLAQRNSQWETALWTMPLQLIMAAAAAQPANAGPQPASPNAPERARPPRRATASIRRPQWQVPTLASLLPGRGRRLTILGIAMDVATCFVVMSALSLLVR
jgi:hypothetical protein